jgi:hypothetical protein
VIAEGLTPGMQVVAAGVHVRPGQKVTVYQDKYAPSGRAPSSLHSGHTRQGGRQAGRSCQ